MALRRVSEPRFVRANGTASPTDAVPDLGGLTRLFGEMGDLKRVRAAHISGSLTEVAFRESWSALISGEDPERVALGVTAKFVAAARLGGLDRGVLLRGGLSDAEATAVLRDSFDSVSKPIPSRVSSLLREALSWHVIAGRDAPPAFAGALARQPRAGCTRPGRPRLVLEPPESHADHCQTVAVYAVLLADLFGSEPHEAFMAGLAHHLHNAGMPDAGFTGEMMLGEHLPSMMGRFTDEALEELPGGLRSGIRAVLSRIGDADDPLGRAFNAADVIDRVLQMRHYAREASFTMDQALEEMDLVHDGPVKAFHETVLSRSGLDGASGRNGP